jgi:hypothetical protein
MPSSGVIDRDLGWNKIVENIHKLSTEELVVGVPADAVYPNRKRRTRVAMIASFYEFGTKRHEARSFLRAAVDGHQQDYADELSKQAGRVLLGMDPDFEALGAETVADVKRAIEARGLVDTGTLQNSIKAIRRPAKKGDGDAGG